MSDVLAVRPVSRLRLGVSISDFSRPLKSLHAHGQVCFTLCGIGESILNFLLVRFQVDRAVISSWMESLGGF